MFVKITSLFICLSSLLLCAVKPQQIENNIVGTWKLVNIEVQARTIGPEKAVVEVPNRLMVIKEEGHYDIIENGELTESDTYEIKPYQILDDPITLKFTSPYVTGTLKFLSPNKVSIGDFGSCTVIETFERK